MVEQWNSVGGIVEQCWWNSGTETVEQCRRNNEVEQCWRSVVNCGTVLEEQWNSVGGTVWWYSGTLLIKQGSGTVKK